MENLLLLPKPERSEEYQSMKKVLAAMGPETFITRMFDPEYINTLLKLGSFFNKLDKSKTAYTIFDVNNLFTKDAIGIYMKTPGVYERLDSMVNQLFDTNITGTEIYYKSEELDVEIKLNHHRYGKTKTTDYMTYKDTYGEVREYIIVKSAYFLNFINYIKSNL